jgi:uncharacterized protein with GYD domain
MANFIILANWTDQGIRNFKDTTKRAEAVSQLIEQNGGKLKEIFWTVGPYDVVVIAEAPSMEIVTAVMLQVGAQGSVRTTTMPAFTKAEMTKILAKTG